MKGKEKSMNQRIIEHLESRLESDEIILSIDLVVLQNNQKKQEDVLVITSSRLFFFQGLSIKKCFQITSIECVTLSPYCNQILLNIENEEKDQVLIESQMSVRIIQNILEGREKFRKSKEKLMVMVDGSKSLDQFLVQDGLKSNKFWGFLFKKTKEKQKQRISGQAYVLEVDLKNFALQIGQTMYTQIYKSTRLLYISSTSSFRFMEESYKAKQISELKWVYRRQKNEKVQEVIVRKIPKRDISYNQQIASVLKEYRNCEYKEQIYYAIETETHFQVVTPTSEGQKNCGELLSNNVSISEKDLRSIFFKLIDMVECNKKVLVSLCPENVIICKDGIKISQVFSSLTRQTQLDYLSPQEFLHQDHEFFTKQMIQQINLWKVGILLYELAYGTLPFPVEYMLYSLLNSSSLIVKFPESCSRSFEFRELILNMIRLKGEARGGSGKNNWKQKVFSRQWVQKTK